MLYKYTAALLLLLAVTTGSTAQTINAALEKKDTALAISILKDGVNINAVDANWASPLLNACRNFGADAFSVGFLLRHGANPDSPRSTAGRTGLIVTCAYYGDVAVCRLLIAYGANINAAAKDGTTALMKAAQNDKADVVEYLLSKGANPALKDTNGKTALDYATASKVDDYMIKMQATCRVDKNETVRLLTKAMGR